MAIYRSPPFVLAGLLGSVLVLFGSMKESPDPPSGVFGMPQILARYGQLQNGVVNSIRKGDFREAESLAVQAAQLLPDRWDGAYNVACAQARQNKLDDAIASLTRAVELGMSDADLLKNDADLESLRDDQRFPELVAHARRNKAAPIAERTVESNIAQRGVVWVNEENTKYDAGKAVFRSLFAFPSDPTSPTASTKPTEAADDWQIKIPPRPIDVKVIVGHGQVGQWLRQWYREGTAAGNYGDVYDNHDGDHSNLTYRDFPQLTRIEFDKAARKNDLHIGLQTRFRYNAVTFGNSSMSIVSGPFWRSQPRLAYTQPRHTGVLYSQYVGNHLYVYPEHRDHDPGHNGKGGWGDLYCTNTPYLLISQGSSWSDKPFLDAIACTLAAFRPEVKSLLAEKGTLMSTLQMILRHSNKQLNTPDDYLTGVAHPSVFRGDQLNISKMVEMAHDIRRDKVPPVIVLQVLEENLGVVGRDYFDAGPRERLFNSPSAIARIVRSTQYIRRMVVTAEASHDLNGRPLSWHWAVLRGDADAIEIRPLNESGSVVELLVPYHRRRPIWPGSDLESNRVDIGAFVHNGKYYSAPGFITFYYLDNENRVYDRQKRIQTVTYSDRESGGNYTDPTIDLPKNWRDEYHYTKDGRLIGWTRHRGGKSEEFTADGAKIIRRDELRRAIEARTVHYEVESKNPSPPVLRQRLGDTILYYDYASPDDRVGRIRRSLSPKVTSPR
jgi:hypothetical protein